MTSFEKTFNLIKKPWFIGAYLVLVILSYHFADKAIATYFYHWDNSHYRFGLHAFSALGKVTVYLFVFVMAGLYFRYLDVKPVYESRTWYLLACVILANLLCWTLKIILARARPELWFTLHAFGFYWFKLKSSYWSFPSGHTMTAFALCSGLSVIFPKHFLAFVVLALLISFSRIVLYFHYLSDVMVGAYLSLLVVGFFTPYFSRK